MLGKIKGKRRRAWQRTSWLDSIIDLMDMNLSKLWEAVERGTVWHVAVHGVAKHQTQLNDCITAIICTNSHVVEDCHSLSI